MRKLKRKPATRRDLVSALRHIAAWNRADIDGFEDISPDMSMLQARARFLRGILRRIS